MTKEQCDPAMLAATIRILEDTNHYKEAENVNRAAIQIEQLRKAVEIGAKGLRDVRDSLDRRLATEPDWFDSTGKRHRYKCGLNPDPTAIKHMVNHCTCPSIEPDGVRNG
jgi:hypothetical protein